MRIRRGFIRCKVCRKKFKLEPTERYNVSNRQVITDCFRPREIFEAFDCPNCGCQNIVGERKSQFVECEVQDEKAE